MFVFGDFNFPAIVGQTNSYPHPTPYGLPKPNPGIVDPIILRASFRAQREKSARPMAPDIVKHKKQGSSANTFRLQQSTAYRLSKGCCPTKEPYGLPRRPRAASFRTPRLTPCADDLPPSPPAPGLSGSKMTEWQSACTRTQLSGACIYASTAGRSNCLNRHNFPLIFLLKHQHFINEDSELTGPPDRPWALHSELPLTPPGGCPTAWLGCGSGSPGGLGWVGVRSRILEGSGSFNTCSCWYVVCVARQALLSHVAVHSISAMK